MVQTENPTYSAKKSVATSGVEASSKMSSDESPIADGKAKTTQKSRSREDEKKLIQDSSPSNVRNLPGHGKKRGWPRGRPRKNLESTASEESQRNGQILLTQNIPGNLGNAAKYAEDNRASISKGTPQQEPKRRGRPKKNTKNPSAQQSDRNEQRLNEEKAKVEMRFESVVINAKPTGSITNPEKREQGKPKKAPDTLQELPQKIIPNHSTSSPVIQKRERPRKSERLSSGNNTVSDKELSDPSEELSMGEDSNSPVMNGIKVEDSFEEHGRFRGPLFITMQNNIFGDGEINYRRLKIASWNLHGIPAGANIKFVKEYILSSNADIICLQGFKLRKREFVDCRLAQKFERKYFFYVICNENTGVGDMILTKLRPLNIKVGMKGDRHNVEGRIITMEFRNLYIVSVEAPGAEEQKLTYRTKEWDVDFNKYMMNLSYKKKLVVVGDMKVSHTDLDVIDSRTFKGQPGHSVEEKQNFAKLLENGLVDTFRHLYPNKKKWTQYDGPDEMKRTDYALVSRSLLPSVVDSRVLDHIQTGYHCPIELHLKFQ